MERKDVFVRGLSIVLVISMVFGSIPYFTMASETVGQIDIEVTNQELATYNLAVSEIELKEIIPVEENQGSPAPSPFATFEIMYADSAIDQGAGAVPEATGTPDDVRFSFGGNANYVRASGSTWGAGAGSILSVEIAAEWSSSGLTDDGAIIQYYDSGIGGVGATKTAVDANNYAVDNTLYLDITADKASWTWTDVGNVNPEIYYLKAGGPDGGTLSIDALWIRVQYESISIDYDIPVTVGWNLISVPSVQGNTDILTVLDDAGGDTTWERASHYNPLIADNLWQSYSIFKPPTLNELNDVNNKLGIWVDITDVGSDGLLTVSGSPPSMTAINLYAGWNLVGYPCLESQMAMNSLAGVPYDALECHDGGAPYLLRTMLNTEMMVPGIGYWIKVTSDCVWNVGDITPPTFAGLVSALDAGTGGSVLLNWNPATDPSYPITYNIYMATTSGGQDFGTPDYITDLTDFQVDGLTDNQDYYFVVRAKDSAGNEDSNLVEKTAIPTTPDATSPWITATVPADAATGIGIAQSIIITFSESINTGTFVYSCAPNPGGWIETWDTFVETNDRVTLTRNDLAFDTLYTFQVTAADDLAGNPLVAGPALNPWTFTTIAAPDLTGPVTSGVSATPNPTDGAGTVTLTATVDDSTTGGSNIAEAEYFVDSVGADGSGTLMVASDGNFNSVTEGVTASIDVSGWALGTYTLYVHGRDASGNWGATDSTILDVTNTPDITSPWIVITAPVDGATGVLIGQSIVITFSESINTGTFAYTCTPNPGGWGESWDAAVETNDRVTLTHSDFAFDTLYDFQVTAADDLAGNPLAAGPVPNPWTFTTELEPTPPQVVEPTSPANGAIDVPATSNIQITFTEAMNEASVESWFNINPATAGTFSWNPGSTILTFTPTGDLAFDQVYTVTIDGLVEDQEAETLDGDYDGVSEGSPTDDYAFSFTTEAAPTPPQVVEPTNPANGDVNVLVTAAIQIPFTEAMNEASTEAAFSIGPVVAGAFSWNVASDIMTFTPSADLSYETTYTVTIDGTAQDQQAETLDGDYDGVSEGSPTDDYSFSFTTEAAVTLPQVTSTIPVNGAAGVLVTDPIIINFNMAMCEDGNGKAPWDAGCVEGAFTVTYGATTLTAGDFTISWNAANDQITFIPVTSYPYGTVMSVTVDGTALETTETYTLDGNYNSVSEGSPIDDYSWSFTTEPAPTPPQVVEPTSPPNGAVDVLITLVIQVTFTEAMNEASTEAAFSIGPVIAGTFSWNPSSTILTFTPSADLAYDTVYSIIIAGTAQDQEAETLDGDYDGVSEGSPTDDYSFSFTTQAAPTPPQVISTSPTDGAIGISLSTTIQITFSEAMNEASTEAAFSIGPVVAGVFSWNPGSTILTFTPSADLSYGTTYTVTIDGTAQDQQGETLDGDYDGVSEGSPTDDYTFGFTTELPPPPQVTSHSPTDGQSNVPLSEPIVINFNMAMSEDGNGKAPWDAGCVEGAFSMTGGLTAGDFTISWNAGVDQLTLTPETPYPSGTVLTVTIDGTAEESTGTQTLDGDYDGTSEGSPTDDYSWSFTTDSGPSTPPQVVEPTAPFNGETNVVASTNIVITFTEAMNEASVESYFSISPAAAGAFSWNPGSTILTFNPNPDLSTTTTYTVTIDGLAEDQEAETLDGDYDGTSEGSPTDDYSFSFTTEAGSVNRYAVCVGIDKHDDGTTTCIYADNDGQDWGNELNSQGYSVSSRLNTAADKAVILGDIADMDTSENAGDYCAFTFAGHGGVSGGTHYIICADWDGTWGTVISDSEFEAAFSGFSSMHIFIFFDSCNSGGMSEVAAAGRLLITACTAVQSSYGGDAAMQNGVWTWYFVEDGIQTQGYTIMEDCFNYAAPEAKSWLTTNYGVTMDPQIFDQYTGDFYL